MKWEKIEMEAKTQEKGSKKERSRSTALEHKKVAIRLKEVSGKKQIEVMREETIRIIQTKDMHYIIDYPTLPITHALIEFQNERIRTQAYVNQSWTEKKIKILSEMDIQGIFQCKRLGYVKYSLIKNWYWIEVHRNYIREKNYYSGWTNSDKSEWK